MGSACRVLPIGSRHVTSLQVSSGLRFQISPRV
ncbi:hypothetical protein MPTK1_4g11390 [Marchantia polymorpha subsp. ruderalis]|uniref:Uncharacterized protein n=2 Tax=Marchantia polymorpha TaxID=3197 RepID=A0AAF6B8S8_MARPO|nr:hypothetical protein MARPO_0011s0123 [Marchantia polymorpha]BBN08412.1 hypothetical protein Mp_4g11390 [Marchantia polymorpha subsp. ruderalis]|eukprot:PTQ46447.1 hypothetical protein MARPO_0011s0123 [Marchantia polymorpha]